MSEDSYQLDGMVRIIENIEHYRYVPWRIYEITRALYMMNEQEQTKVMKYIARITDKRISFSPTNRRVNKKKLFAAMEKLDRKLAGN